MVLQMKALAFTAGGVAIRFKISHNQVNQFYK